MKCAILFLSSQRKIKIFIIFHRHKIITKHEQKFQFCTEFFPRELHETVATYSMLNKKNNLYRIDNSLSTTEIYRNFGNLKLHYFIYFTQLFKNSFNELICLVDIVEIALNSTEAEYAFSVSNKIKFKT